MLLLQLLVQGASLWRLHRASRPAAAGVRFRAVAGVVSPVSFGRAVYLNPAHHAPTELPVVLLHEQVHIRQAHPLDVLLGHLHRVLAWVSPAAWLWLRATQENLEFIADAAVLQESQLAPQQYQYSLIKLSALAAGPAFVKPFSFITLKNHIRMINSLPAGGNCCATPLVLLCWVWWPWVARRPKAVWPKVRQPPQHRSIPTWKR